MRATRSPPSPRSWKRARRRSKAALAVRIRSLLRSRARRAVRKCRHSQKKLNLSVDDRSKPYADGREQGLRAHAHGSELLHTVGGEFIRVEAFDPCREAVGLVANILRGELPVARSYPQCDRDKEYADENKLQSKHEPCGLFDRPTPKFKEVARSFVNLFDQPDVKAI